MTGKLTGSVLSAVLTISSQVSADAGKILRTDLLSADPAAVLPTLCIKTRGKHSAASLHCHGMPGLNKRKSFANIGGGTIKKI